MPQKQLLETLRELHEELSRADQVEPETLELLHTVTSDIERLLERSEATPPEEAEPVHEGLQELLLKFEGQHPQLVTFLHRLTDGLGNLGI